MALSDLPTPSPSQSPAPSDLVSGSLTVETVLILILVVVICYMLGILVLHLVRSMHRSRKGRRTRDRLIQERDKQL